MRTRFLAGALVLFGCAAVIASDGPAIGETQAVPAIPVVAGPPSDLAQTTERAREYAKLVFAHPVKVINTWLQGTYIVEHDKDRMARGEPCTRIYRVEDRTKPVVEFHCEHLDRVPAEQGKVTLKRIGITPPAYELKEFQFEGSNEGHGVPPAK